MTPLTLKLFLDQAVRPRPQPRSAHVARTLRCPGVQRRGRESACADRCPCRRCSAQARPDGPTVVFVGDPNQHIYFWNGTRNAIRTLQAHETFRLTGCFRFDAHVAADVNKLLSAVGETSFIRGLSGRAAAVEVSDTLVVPPEGAPRNVYLVRSWAGALEQARARRRWAPQGSRRLVTRRRTPDVTSALHLGSSQMATLESLGIGGVLRKSEGDGGRGDLEQSTNLLNQASAASRSAHHCSSASKPATRARRPHPAALAPLRR